MTPDQFAEGTANPARQALVDAVKPFIRQTDSNGYQWWPGYDSHMQSMFGITDEKLSEHPLDEEDVA